MQPKDPSQNENHPEAAARKRSLSSRAYPARKSSAISIAEYVEKARGRYDTLSQRLQQVNSSESEDTRLEVLEELQTSLEELRVAQEELAAARHTVERERQRYQALFDFAPDAYLVTDCHGTIREANQVAFTLFGMASRPLIGKPLVVFVAAPDHSSFRRLLHRLNEVKDAATVLEWEGEMSPRNGPPMQVALRVSSTTNDDGDRMLRWMLRDMTSRKQAEGVLRGQTAALTTTLHALTARLELNAFLQRVLMTIAMQLDMSWTTLWYFDSTSESWTFALQHDRVPIADERAYASMPSEIPIHEMKFIEEMLQTRRAVAIRDAQSNSRLSRAEDWQAHGIRSLLLVPLLLGEEVIGMLRLRDSEPHLYNLEELELAQALAQQAALAVQLTRLAEQQQQAMVLEERNRIAREIHDTLAQGFTGITLQLEAAEDTLAIAPDKAQEHIVRARELARDSLTEARRSVYALRPTTQQSHDLPSAMVSWIKKHQAKNAGNVTFSLKGAPLPLPDETEVHLLRICQEALTNAFRHANARQIVAELTYAEQEVRLRIADDGKGFALRDGEVREGFGLLGIRERVERIRGSQHMVSEPGQGTEIIVTVPLAI